MMKSSGTILYNGIPQDDSEDPKIDPYAATIKKAHVLGHHKGLRFSVIVFCIALLIGISVAVALPILYTRRDASPADLVDIEGEQLNNPEEIGHGSSHEDASSSEPSAVENSEEDKSVTPEDSINPGEQTSEEKSDDESGEEHKVEEEQNKTNENGVDGRKEQEFQENGDKNLKDKPGENENPPKSDEDNPGTDKEVDRPITSTPKSDLDESEVESEVTGTTTTTPGKSSTDLFAKGDTDEHNDGNEGDDNNEDVDGDVIDDVHNEDNEGDDNNEDVDGDAIDDVHNEGDDNNEDVDGDVIDDVHNEENKKDDTANGTNSTIDTNKFKSWFTSRASISAAVAAIAAASTVLGVILILFGFSCLLKRNKKRNRRVTIKDMVTDLQSPDKVILLNGETSEEEYVN